MQTWQSIRKAWRYTICGAGSSSTCCSPHPGEMKIRYDSDANDIVVPRCSRRWCQDCVSMNGWVTLDRMYERDHSFRSAGRTKSARHEICQIEGSEFKIPLATTAERDELPLRNEIHRARAADDSYFRRSDRRRSGASRWNTPRKIRGRRTEWRGLTFRGSG